MGKVGLALSGTRVLNFFTQPLTGGPAYNCAGYFGTTCGAPTPHWRHVLQHRLADAVARNRICRALALHRTDAVRPREPRSATRRRPTLRGPRGSAATHTSICRWRCRSRSTGIDLRVGVNNMTDKAPPIVANGNYSDCPNSSCNDNTWVGTYDTMGRYLYAHVSVKF